MAGNYKGSISISIAILLPISAVAGDYKGSISIWPLKNSKEQIEIVWLEINPFATATANVNVKHVSKTNRF